MVACGSGIATATIVADKVREICEAAGIDIEIFQCGIREIAGKASEVDLVVTTARYQGQPVGKPIVNALAVLTGVGVEAFASKVVEALKQN